MSTATTTISKTALACGWSGIDYPPVGGQRGCLAIPIRLRYRDEQSSFDYLGYGAMPHRKYFREIVKVKLWEKIPREAIRNLGQLVR